jgi:bifunctional non-homologous end joining protein LigD
MYVARPADVARVAAKIPVCYVVFDLLWLDGQDLTGFTYLERRHLLVELVEPGARLLVPAHQLGDGADLLEAARQSRLEGIVAKRIDSLYRPGARSPMWRKVKIRPRQEFVIGGWHPGERGRAGQLGSLLLGYYEDAALRYAGKVGTGFKARELDRLAGLLGALAADETPFTPTPPPFVARTARWVRPELVAEVTFGEWTDEGILRHPSYIATRADTDPRDVVRET